MTLDTLEVGLPKKMEMYQDGSYLVVVRKWFGVKTVATTFVAVCWDGYMYRWYIWYTHDPTNVPSLFLWFLILLVAAGGVFVTYLAIAGWLNQTHVRIGSDTVTVTTSPLPFFNNRVITSSAIKRLYSEERISSGESSYTTL